MLGAWQPLHATLSFQKSENTGTVTKDLVAISYNHVPCSKIIAFNLGAESSARIDYMGNGLADAILSHCFTAAFYLQLAILLLQPSQKKDCG